MAYLNRTIKEHVQKINTIKRVSVKVSASLNFDLHIELDSEIKIHCFLLIDDFVVSCIMHLIQVGFKSRRGRAVPIESQ